jgi:hypothetical protein
VKEVVVVKEEVKIDPAEAKRLKNEKDQIRKMKSKVRKLIMATYIADVTEEETEKLADGTLDHLKALQKTLAADADGSKKGANLAMLKKLLAKKLVALWPFRCFPTA